jgi:hypothetical protein
MNHTHDNSRQEIETFLNEMKVNERLSPSGMYWNDFFIFLKSFRQSGETDPPVPLILAASGESDALKYLRLSKQLQWALDYDCLNEAINFLRNISPDKWNSGTLDNWNKENY